jgi:SAM-dependent methyltransferase
MSVTQSRQAHAVLDMPSRRLKALKIERLLGLDQSTEPICMLEVGCGSGGISHYFGTHPSARFEVHAVDVTNSRLVFDAYDFHVVPDTELPYPDARFDVALSNHVIEHVGDEAAQLRHLRELRRVLKPGGVGYLAVPNRWMLVEPHYRLAFLSWLPVKWRSPYLRLFRDAEYYDCRPLELREAERMLREAGLAFENLCVDGIRAVFLIEGAKGFVQNAVSMLPDRILAWMNPINPTLIYKVKSLDAMRHKWEEIP